MGSIGSRGKKVAPASATNVNVYQSEDSAECQRKDGDAFNPLKIQKLADINRSWSRGRPDYHSEGNDSEFSADDDDIEFELDRVMAEYEKRQVNSITGSKKKSVERSKTCGFSNTERAYSGRDFTPAPRFNSSEPPGRIRHPCSGGSVGASDKELANFIQPLKKAHYDSKSKFSQDARTLGKSGGPGLAEELALVPGCCDTPGLALPIILYNGSEEDLIEAIEREFC
ncbi:hypothetical protein GJAV_G00014100 [Gymnothorax javanicus]|nr:hypothetical protein GJAV_G00014100 [Gymnothorax javanicus]